MSKICTIGIWDETIPGINFDQNGISNYYHLQKSLEANFPRGEKGESIWEDYLHKIKSQAKNRKYDCIVGVSGGVDSSYLLYTIKEKYNLNPLAVTLDNGFSSKVAIQNIQKITNALDIDLETYVVDYEEIKDLIKVYMKAGLPWIDTPTDIAILGSLYKIANKENIKFIIRGNDFRSEGKQPREWTYSDHKQFKHLIKKYGSLKSYNSFPFLSFTKRTYLGYFKKIKEVRPYYYLDYDKQSAKKFLTENYNWEDYGGHHHENIFTKFTMSDWLPNKFSIDKRKINLSAQIVSGVLSREDALEEVSKSSLSSDDIIQNREYVSKKLDLSKSQFDEIWNSPNKMFYDYPNHFDQIQKALKLIQPVYSRVFSQKPMSLFEMENRKNTN